MCRTCVWKQQFIARRLTRPGFIKILEKNNKLGSMENPDKIAALAEAYKMPAMEDAGTYVVRRSPIMLS